jgi:hypothetical protein
MDGTGICTACGAEAELDAKQTCPDCASGSMESDDDTVSPEGGKEKDTP